MHCNGDVAGAGAHFLNFRHFYKTGIISYGLMEETIIIGGGIAGLACAKELFKNNASFKLISVNIGGRITTSEDGKINYSAYIVSRYYKNFKKFVRLTRPIRIIRDCKFHYKKESYDVNYFDLFSHPLTIFKTIIIFLKFRREYRLFQKDCCVMSQKEAIKRRKVMFSLLKMNSKQFLKKNKLESIHQKYVSQYGNSIGFKNHHNSKLLGGFIGADLLLSGPKEFIFQKEKLITPFEKNIVNDKIIEIKRVKGGYKLKSSKKIYSCKNLVVATPIWVSNKLLKLNLNLKTINVDMIHLNGKIKKGFEKRFNLFNPKEIVSVIAKQADGSFLVFYEGRLKLGLYFNDYKIIKKISFKPALTTAQKFIESKLAKNLFLIGDYNISSVEDSYLTGVYAANQIIKEIN